MSNFYKKKCYSFKRIDCIYFPRYICKHSMSCGAMYFLLYRYTFNTFNVHSASRDTYWICIFDKSLCLTISSHFWRDSAAPKVVNIPVFSHRINSLETAQENLCVLIIDDGLEIINVKCVLSVGRGNKINYSVYYFIFVYLNNVCC